MRPLPKATLTITAVDGAAYLKLQKMGAAPELYHFSHDDDAMKPVYYATAAFNAAAMATLFFVEPVTSLKIFSGLSVFNFFALSSSVGHITNTQPPIPGGFQPGAYASIRYAISLDQYEVMHRELRGMLGKVRPYSRPFYNCAHFVTNFAHRHGIDLKANRFFTNPGVLRTSIVKMHGSTTRHIRARVIGKPLAMWRGIFIS